MKTFTEIIRERDEEEGGYGIPSLTGQECVHILKEYLLGEDWYTASATSPEQVNTVIVAEILYKYSKKYRKEVKLDRLNKRPPSLLRRILLWVAQRV